MKHTLLLVVVFCTFPFAGAEHLGVYQHGTVVRMRTGECVFAHRGFMAAMAEQAGQISPDICLEYTCS
jgi:hypothetical protein